MNTYITLPCGCKITPTTVIAMCGNHAQQWGCENAERESSYREYVNRMSLACAQASSQVRRMSESTKE